MFESCFFGVDLEPCKWCCFSKVLITIIAKLLQLVECMCSRLCSDFPPFFWKCLS